MWQIGPVLELRDEHWDAICAHGLRAYPLEACGLLIGEWQGDRVIRFEPTPNAARSSRIYEAKSAGSRSSQIVPRTLGSA